MSSVRWRYTTDASLFANQVAVVREIAGVHDVWVGIGAYRLSPAQIADNVQTARRAGASGVILFLYDSLTDPAHGPGYIWRSGGTRSLHCNEMVLTWLDYVVIGGYLLGDHGLRVVFRPLSENHPRLLSHRPIGAVVGDLFHDRRHRNQHADLHQRAGERPTPATMTFLQLVSATSSAG